MFWIYSQIEGQWNFPRYKLRGQIADILVDFDDNDDVADSWILKVWYSMAQNQRNVGISKIRFLVVDIIYKQLWCSFHWQYDVDTTPLFTIREFLELRFLKKVFIFDYVSISWKVANMEEYVPLVLWIKFFFFWCTLDCFFRWNAIFYSTTLYLFLLSRILE